MDNKEGLIELLEAWSNSIEKEQNEILEWRKLFEDNEGIVTSHKVYSNNNPYKKPLTIYYSNILNSLTNVMKGVLMDILLNNRIIESSTTKALTKRNLIQNQCLTDDGKIIAISLLSLKEQCRILQIDYNEIKSRIYGSPEALILLHYQEQGFYGLFTEYRLIVSILKTVLLSVLYPKASIIFTYADSYRIDFYGRTILQSVFSTDTFNEIIQAFSNINKDDFIYYFELSKNIETQTDFVTPSVKFSYGRNTEFIDFDTNMAFRIFVLLGRSKWIDIFQKINRNEITYAGWPDLIVFDNDTYAFVEVKKNDILLPTQIATISQLRALGLDIKVNKCVKI